MKETNIKGYTMKCPKCDQKFTSLSEKQLKWNLKIHYDSCKKKKDPNKIQKEVKQNGI